MEQQTSFRLDLPPSLSNPNGDCWVESDRAIVVIGANGSGKTRLGSWIEFESKYKEHVHRLSAQKSLDMPKSSGTTAMDEARADLHYGTTEDRLTYKLSHRWHNNPNTALLNDFDKLMVYLFSEEFEKSIEYRRTANVTTDYQKPPETKLDLVKRIWQSVLPDKELVIGSGKVEVKSNDRSTEAYNASEMSDGERIVFYLIGECLAAPEGAAIVVDEPEMHLHKSIQASLWDAIELERPDCLFVYLTHDLDFAASRVRAPKICLKGFDGKRWDWYKVPENSEIPEDILLQIVGSRPPVLFVEGEKGSLDSALFRNVYPEFTVVPCGGCESVIHATHSFALLKHLHDLECRGIVDRDYRSDEEIKRLRERNVLVLEVSEVENLFLSKAVLEQVAEAHLLHDSFSAIMTKVEKVVFSKLERDKERIASGITAAKIRAMFKKFNAKAIGQEQIQEAWESFEQSVQVEDIYKNTLSDIESVLADGDYDRAIRLYGNKGLVRQVSTCFEMKSPGYKDYVLRLLASEQGKRLMSVIREHAPRISL